MAQKVTNPREFSEAIRELTALVPISVREHAWDLLTESVEWVERQAHERMIFESPAEPEFRRAWAKRLREHELEDVWGRNFYTGTGLAFAADLLDPDIEDPK
ncbi:hypothetical protein SEA_GODPOWER_63 [Streptomyces phage Godpower]|uniref:Uncharacterized protein n=2 Tax=Likavirus TaxID=1982880 RepID=A0A1C9LXK5_9CAUD|nr:hypothetical protein M050_gp63 [Streptomyces phage Sujidade]AGM12161.1 hypothetical protein SUJIDADE_63 [Streptomyces phage Sujidade]AOQ27038.1 hypothetical protein SEA_GODPOWER_63 [Streptomyces phage Godpower]